MLAALAAALGRPGWWSMALAAFLIRGGIIVVLVPLIPVPSIGSLVGQLSPAVSAVAFAGVTTTTLVAVAGLVGAVAGVVAVAGLAGAWLDLAQLREAAGDEDLDLSWAPTGGSLREALALRLAAHLPTLAAATYASFRVIAAGYDEVLAPGDAAVPLAARVLGRVPDAAVVLAVAWLLGEAVGGLAARSAAAGAPFRAALAASARQVAGRRGLATLALTTAGVLVALVPLLIVAGNARQQLRDQLMGAVDPILVAASLLALVAAWILGLTFLGAVLAWRTAAWTVEARPAPRTAATASLLVPEG